MPFLLAFLWLVLPGKSAEAPVPGPAADCFVAVTGSDQNPGTLERPFASLERAKRFVRARKKSMSKGLVSVCLREGTYFLRQPLVFGPGDGGGANLRVEYRAYPGEHPVISGDRPLPAWKAGKGNRWQAAMPQAKSDGWRFRHLLVAGREMPRARWPKPGLPYIRLFIVPVTKPPYTDILKLPEGSMAAFQGLADAEIVLLKGWECLRKRIAEMDPGKNRMVLAPRKFRGVPYLRPRSRVDAYFENAPEFMDQSGEWCLQNKRGLLIYWPLPGQPRESTPARAPYLKRLLLVRGTAARPVRNLHFNGIGFEGTDWPLPPVGYEGLQACFHLKKSFQGGPTTPQDLERMPAAVSFEYASLCSLESSEIYQAGGTGLELRRGCSFLAIRGNRIHDIGGNGIMVGENLNLEYTRHPQGHPLPAGDIPRDLELRNNEVTACGRDFSGAVGIWAAFCRRVRIAGNEVHDLPYTGISLGFMWNSQPTVCSSNAVESNRVYDVMKVSSDGAGIYTLGKQPDTVIRGNIVHDVMGGKFGTGMNNCGIYLDEGSSGILVEKNRVFNTCGPAILFHGTNQRQARDNQLGPGVTKPAIVAAK